MEDNKMFQEEEVIDIKEILNQYLSYWKWFLLSIILAIIGAVVYLKITPKEYESEAKLLLKSESGGMSVLPGFSELASITDASNSEIDDQIEVLKSRRLMTKVVDKLGLNISYYQKNFLKNEEIYQKDAPVYVSFFDERTKYKLDSLIEFEIEIVSKDQYVYHDLESGSKKNSVFGKPLKLSFGDIIIFKSPKFKEEDKLRITLNSLENVALQNIKKLEVKSISKKGNSISLSIKSSLPDNSNKIIDSLVVQYNSDIIEDRKKVGNATISFINDRLDLISQDLQSVDNTMQQYKSEKRITDIITEGQTAVQQYSKIEEQLKQYNIQLSLISYMENFIKTNNKSLVPSNIGLEDSSILQATQQYNQLVLERDNLLKSATEENPVVQSLDNRIKEFNNNLATSLRNYKTTTEIALRGLRGQENQIKGNISELPVKERGFRDIARKQQTVEALYLLLLQKREETEVTTASTPDMVKIIDNSYYSKIPIAPKKSIILLGAILLGLVIPFSILYVKFLLDDKIKSRKDVEKIIRDDISIMGGYIPKSESNIVDIQSANSPIAEAFRVLRTNVDFLLPSNIYSSKCIYISSTISGEGKTFIAINLAYTLALTGKRILILEADIRKPKVRKYLGVNGTPKGITEYLSGNISDISKEIITVNYADNINNPIKIDLFPSGRIAPNPSELFLDQRFKEIVDYGLGNYDYIIVDTAPLSVVADTLLINNYADLLLYVVRVGYLKEKALGIINQLKKDRKIENHKTSILINDLDAFNEYGYNYGYGDEDIKPWYRKMFNI